MRFVYFLLTALALPFLANANGCGGKIDIGPIFAHVDVLDSGRTIKKLDMGGAKVNTTIMLKEGRGFCLKPDVLYASGHGELISGSIGFGHVTPLTKKLCITPSFGCTLTNLRTSVSVPVMPGLPNVHFKQRFRSVGPYICIEATYKIVEGLRIGGNVMYSWSHTHTRTRGRPGGTRVVRKDKGNSAGPTYAAMLEKDLSDKLSVNIGAMYNTSLDHQKHGIRGYGFKMGMAYWF